MRVVLVYPTTGTVFEHPPLGLMYIASVIRQDGHDVKIIESQKGDVSRLQLVEKFYPHVVGITCMTPMYDEVLNIARYIKNHFVGTPKVYIGGPHATIMPETLLKNVNVDACIVGEGEITFAEMLIANDPLNVDGVAYRDEEDLIIRPREPIKDLDMLPFPARDLVDKRYFERKRTPIITSRGCPFNCAFCQPTLRKMFGAAVRRRSVENVIDEMKECNRKYKLSYFEFLDDTFTSDKEWINKFACIADCEQVNNRLRSKFEVLTRVDMVDDELIGNLKYVGLSRATFGVESGDQSILNGYCKGTTLSQVRKAFEVCKRNDVRTHALFMLGSIDETHESIEATENLIKELKPDSLYISITTPIPHTKLWDECRRENALTCDWSEIDYYRTPSMKLKYLTSEEVVKARQRILRSFYMRKLRSPRFVARALTAHPLSYTLRAAKHVMGEHS